MSANVLSLCPFVLPPRISEITHGVHALPVERHHSMGRISHKDALVIDVIRGALDRHHSLGWEAEIIPLEGITSKHAQKYKKIRKTW